MAGPREILLTNSLTRKKEKFVPIESGKVRFYSCGPTVYGNIHIGNLRAAVTADTFVRTFRRAGYEVIYVRNFTDVDDKIIKRANEEKTTSEAVANRFVQEVEKDYAVAGLLDPSQKPRVTTHMKEIISMIEKIIEHGKAYVVDGEVFFSVGSFEGYGKLSGKNIDELLVGARVEVNERKRNALDFSLWKPAKPGEPSWDSPWGKGRPGWHIECSAMASRWLGEQIDVHHGGEDLIFPHHENEIAQSEAACGKAPYVRYWLHNAFLTLSKEKMSKSLGNIFEAHDFLARYSGEVARYLLLSGHYRSILDFGDDAIEQALSGLQRIYEAKSKAKELQALKRAMPDRRAEEAWGSFVADCEKARLKIEEAMFNDFNTPEAFAAVFTLIRDFNRTVSVPLAQATPSAVLGSAELVKVLEQELGDFLGLGRLDPEKALSDLARIRQERPGLPSEDEIKKAIQDRAEARKAKDFAKSDQIRKDLESRGVLIKDGPAGTTWTYK